MKLPFLREHTPAAQTDGFTLVETLVAVSILLLVILGPMTIAMKGMQMGFFANEEMTAVFLAQEAIESIEKLRDDNALSVLYDGGTNTWSWHNNLLADCKVVNVGCGYNVVANSFIQCDGPNPCRLEYDPTGTEYVYGYFPGNNPLSPYTRKIVVGDAAQYAANHGVLVTVTVSWSTNLFENDRIVTLQSWIYDTYEHYQP